MSLAQKTFKQGGVHPPDNKLSKSLSIEKFAVPETVSIMTSQHIGAPAAVAVQPNDKVKVGQLIAKSQGFISANTHSSVSGTVLKVGKIMDASGYPKDAVIIKVEGDEWLESIDRSDKIIKEITLDADEIRKCVSDAGIVGLGGATFPSHVKLSVPEGKKAEYLIINGAECEPYLTADYRLMLEKPEEILIGIQIALKALGIKKALLGIESNKPNAIKLFGGFKTDYPEIEVVSLTTKYPQGGERQIVKALTGREIPPPPKGLPMDVGCIVFNVGTIFAIYEAVQKHKPLIDRVLTVSGKNLKTRANLLVRIGTPLSLIFDYVGGIPEDTGKILFGGPMMGRAVGDAGLFSTKGLSGLVILPQEESKRKAVQNCIRCAKCVNHCPLGLEPYLLQALVEKNRLDDALAEKVLSCCECGCCSFICPSNRALLDYIKLGKTTLLAELRKKKA